MLLSHHNILYRYRCADLLVMLPGYIPIPSFGMTPPLPASDWIDAVTSRPYPELARYFAGPVTSQELLSSISHPNSVTCPPTQSSTLSRPGPRQRRVIPAPLIVRKTTKDPSPYSQHGRSKLLAEIGVPPELYNLESTRILVVSFGGQVFKRPMRSGSRTPASREHSPDRNGHHHRHRRNKSSQGNIHITPSYPVPSTPLIPSDSEASPSTSLASLVSTVRAALPRPHPILSPLATETHFFIPGAPPVTRNRSITSRSPATSPRNRFPSFPNSPALQDIPSFITIPPTPNISEQLPFSAFVPPDSEGVDNDEENDIADLLPDERWIAIVCGVSKEQWLTQQVTAGEDALPDNFFVAPRDVYMPDLTAVGDVLLGKLVRIMVFRLWGAALIIP